MGERKEYKLDEVYEFKSGLSKPAEEFGFGAPFLSFKEVFKNYYMDETPSELVNSNAKEQETCSIRRGDVFLTRTSETMHELGMSCVALCDVEKGTFNGFCKRLRPNGNIEIIPEYATYYFRSPKFRAAVTAMSSPSTRASLNNEMLSKLTIVVPEKHIQITVGSILKSLDDKIELNRNMNETLEEMARAIFKSWFVDFDPVHAKARGEKPAGMPIEVADLFPSEFVHSDQLNKPIPKGWEVKSISLLAENVKRAIGAENIDPESNYIGLEHMPKRSIALTDWERAEKVTSNKFGFKTGEILFGKLRPYFHKVGIAPVDGICSTDILVIKPKKERHFGVVLCAASSDVIITSVTSSSTGTKMPRTNWQDISKFTVVIPDNEIMDSFNHYIKTLTSKIINNIHENIILTKTRDTLLPKLISGEIEVI